MSAPTVARRVPRAIIAVGVLGLVLAVVGAVLFVVPSRSADAGESADSKAALAAVSDFSIAYNTYDVADSQDYQQRVTGLLTSDYSKEFKQLTTALFTAIKSKKQKSSGAVVRDVAVESIDGDSAVVLAVVDAKVTNTDTEQAILRQFRWTVNLQKVGSAWKISRFESVAAQPAGGTDGGASATPTPTAPTATPTAGDDQ